MKLSVVLITYNQHDLLRKCLRSVVRALEGIDGRIIVVDNASDDATAEVLRDEFAGVQVIRNEVNLYYIRAANQGLRAANGEYCFLLNDDTELAPDCISTLLKFMEAHPRCGAVGPKMVTPDNDPDPSVHRFPTPLREILHVSGIAWRLRKTRWAEQIGMAYKLPLPTQKVDGVGGGAILLRGDALSALNYHDEKYLFYRDDPDLAMRLTRAGWEIWYCAETQVIHYQGMSSVKSPHRVRFEMIAVRSRRHFHYKFHGLLAAALVEATDAANTLLRVLKSILLLRFADTRKHVSYLGVLLTAFAMPDEERKAMNAYRDAAYNGMDSHDRPVTCVSSQ
jgi:GT2 family glycosyltransferase